MTNYYYYYFFFFGGGGDAPFLVIVTELFSFLF